MAGLRSAVLMSALAVAACLPPTSSPSVAPTAALSARPSPTPVPEDATNAVSVPPNACSTNQIEIRAEGSAEDGFAAILVRPAGDRACVVRLYPPTAIQDLGGITLVESRDRPGGPEFYALDRELAFDLSWAVVCPRPTLLRPLTAWIAFADPNARIAVRLPDAFTPSCVLFSPGMEVAPGFDLNGEGGEGGLGG